MTDSKVTLTSEMLDNWSAITDNMAPDRVEVPPSTMRALIDAARQAPGQATLDAANRMMDAWYATERQLKRSESLRIWNAWTAVMGWVFWKHACEQTMGDEAANLLMEALESGSFVELDRRCAFALVERELREIGAPDILFEDDGNVMFYANDPSPRPIALGETLLGAVGAAKGKVT